METSSVFGDQTTFKPEAHILPNGRRLLDDGQLTLKQLEWQEVKAQLSNYPRKERRHLRWQVLKEARGPRHRRENNAEELPSSERQDSGKSALRHKSSQTDAFVVMDAAVLTNTSDDEDLEDFVLSKYFSNLYNNNGEDSALESPPVSPSPSLSSSAFTMEPISPSVLPPISPCLQGTCPLLAGVLKPQRDPVWLGCKYKDRQTGNICSYWVHAKCHGFPKMSQEVVKLAKGFRCPLHLE